MHCNQQGQAVFPISRCSGPFDIGRELYDGQTSCVGARGVVFDWSGVAFAGVSTLTALVALHLKISHLGHKVAVIAPNSKDVDRYISRMDYFNQIGFDHVENFSRHEEGNRFLPIARFSADENRSELPERVGEAIISHTPLSRNLKAAVDYIFGEVMDNVCVHAQSLIGGYIGVQFYPAKHAIELCISDGGCGIPASLKRNALFEDMADIDVLPSALEYGVGENVSGERGSQGYGRGKGLAIIKNMVSCADGRMCIVSGCAGIEVDANGVRKVPDVCYPGTVVSIEMPTYSHREVTAEELFFGMEGSVLLDDLLLKYGASGRADEAAPDVLW